MFNKNNLDKKYKDYNMEISLALFHNYTLDRMAHYPSTNLTHWVDWENFGMEGDSFSDMSVHYSWKLKFLPPDNFFHHRQIE